MSPLVLALLLGSAVAADKAVTSVGAELTRSQAAGEADVDLLLAERFGWTIAEAGFTARVLGDLRFTLDPDGPDPVERARVSRLGVQLDEAGWRVELGRHPVYRGGPRLVDGVQALVRTGGLELGAWGGLAPDLFTTIPRLRSGGGPIVAWSSSSAQLSAVGEFLVAEGSLDRLGALLQARYSAAPLLDTSGRLDVQRTESGGLGVADASLFARLRPTGALRLDASYSAYSSLRYLSTADLDPDLRRFSTRIEALGVAEGITQDARDPTLHHLAGLGLRAEARDSALRPRAALTARYRYHPDPANRYARLTPMAGLGGLLGDHLDLEVDASILAVDQALQGDAGITAILQPTDEGLLTLDASLRALVVPDDYGPRPGWYGDLFVDLATRRLLLIAGVYLEHEPRVDFEDVALGGFVRASWVLRPPRSAPRSEPGS